MNIWTITRQSLRTLLLRRWGANILCSLKICSSWLISLNSSWNSSRLPNWKNIGIHKWSNPNKFIDHVCMIYNQHMQYIWFDWSVPLTFPASRKCISMKSSSRLFWNENTSNCEKTAGIYPFHKFGYMHLRMNSQVERWEHQINVWLNSTSCCSLKWAE